MKRAWIILLNCKKMFEKLEQNNRWVKRSCDWNRILPLCIVPWDRLPQPKASATVWPRLHIFFTLQCRSVAMHVRYFCRAKQHVVATCPLLALLLSMTSSLKQVLFCFGAKVPLDIFLLWNKKTKKAFLRPNSPPFPTNQNHDFACLIYQLLLIVIVVIICRAHSCRVVAYYSTIFPLHLGVERLSCWAL